MKKVKIFALGFAALMGAFLLNSCKDDAATTPAPTITFTVDGAQTTSVDVTDGEVVSYELRVTASGEIKSITIYEGTDESNRTQTHTKTADFTIDTMDLTTYSVTASATVTKVMVEVTDKKDQVTKKALSLVIGSGADLTEHTSVVLGAQTNAAGSCYLSATNVVQSVNSATAASVDFIYYYGATNKASLGAPSNADVQTVYAGVASWATKNATKLSIVTDDYATITKSSDISAATGSAVTQLAVGNVFSFETAAGKKGIAKVISITPADNTGAITLSVKVQN